MLSTAIANAIMQIRRKSSRLRRAKLEINHESRCFQKSALVFWGANMSIGGEQAPPGPLLRRPCYREFTVQINLVAKRTVIIFLIIFLL